MTGGWADSDRKSQLPANWASVIVPEVKRRAGNRCQKILRSGARCPRAGTDVDHVIPGGSDDYHNLRLLCTEHHAQKSSREGNAARRGKKASRHIERHPGLR